MVFVAVHDEVMGPTDICCQFEQTHGLCVGLLQACFLSLSLPLCSSCIACVSECVHECMAMIKHQHHNHLYQLTTSWCFCRPGQGAVQASNAKLFMGGDSNCKYNFPIIVYDLQWLACMISRPPLGGS
jgi:hypothetical protein